MGSIELSPIHDIYISAAFRDKNFVNADALFAGRYLKPGNVYRSLMKFDLSALIGMLTPDSRIKSALLKLNIFRNEVPSIPDKAFICVHRLTEGFDAKHVTWHTRPAAAPYPVGTAAVGPQFKGIIDIDITQLVKGWTDETIENCGILIKGSEDISGIIAFGSTRLPDAAIRPRLVVDFTRDDKEENDLSTFWGLYNYRKDRYTHLLNSPMTKESEEIISKIKEKKYKGIVVYPEAVFWEPIQRPQQMLRELAKKGYLCFFCDPPKGEFKITEIEENLFIVNDEAYLIPVLRSKFTIVLCTWLIQTAWADLLPNKFVWYDILDKIEFFSMYDDGTSQKHELQVREADFVSYSSKLLKKYTSLREDAVYLPNGCSVSDFINGVTIKTPKSMEMILKTKKPIIGYFGAVERWFDDKLVKNLAARNPDWEFVIIGRIGIDENKLKAPNIHLIGMVPYNELPSLARHFDAAIIPFKVSDLTDCVSPVKFFEYASLGKPVVSTPILEMEQYSSKWVFIAKGVDAFENAIKRCLSGDVRKKAMDEGVKFACRNQWAGRVEALEKALISSTQGWLAFSNIYNTGTAAVMTATFLDFEGRNFYSGGAERYLLDLKGICDKLGLNLSIYQYGNSPWVRRFRNTNVYSLSTGDFDATVFSAENLSRFNHIFYEIVEGRTLLNIYSAFFEGYPMNAKPSIGISHGVAWDSPYYSVFSGGRGSLDRQKRFIEAARLCDHLISVDTNTPNWFQTMVFSIGSSMKYIPNYVDTEEFTPREGFESRSEKRVLLYPRRLYEARGFYMVIGIMDSILESYEDVEFHFVGRGSEKDTKFVTEKQKKWGDRVKWYFKMPEEMPDVYKNGDIALIPTLYSEGTSLSCLEAMASGNACVATRIGGLSNLVIDGYNGYLIEPDEDSLKAALEDLLNNPDKLVDFKRKSIEVAKTFSKEAWENRWACLIKGIIGNAEVPKVPHEPLVEIYLDSLSNWPLEHLGVLVTGLLSKGCLVYIRVKDTGKFKPLCFGRAQWVPWDEEDIAIPEFVIADGKSAGYIYQNKKVNLVIDEQWMKNFIINPGELFRLLGIE